MKRYGYHRTSTREQHLDRGIAEITAYCEQNQLELEKIFTDQQTGKNFNRPRYQVLKEDVMVILYLPPARVVKEQRYLRTGSLQNCLYPSLMTLLQRR